MIGCRATWLKKNLAESSQVFPNLLEDEEHLTVELLENTLHLETKFILAFNVKKLKFWWELFKTA